MAVEAQSILNTLDFTMNLRTAVWFINTDNKLVELKVNNLRSEENDRDRTNKGILIEKVHKTLTKFRTGSIHYVIRKYNNRSHLKACEAITVKNKYFLGENEPNAMCKSPKRI